MEILKTYKSVPESLKSAHLAIGNFDGIHKGHRVVIDAALKAARTKGQPAGVMMFEPHPQRFFKPDQPFYRLNSLQTQATLLAEAGLEFLLLLPFDAELAAKDPQQFVDEILVQALAVSHVIIGYDFHFGKDRAGTADRLRQLATARGVKVTIIGRQDCAENTAYSSTRIRELITQGDVKAAAQLLGRPWLVTGTVVEGDHRGRLIGFPTANIPLGDHVIPAHGVYAVRAQIDGAWHQGVANVGRRPTFDKPDILLEVYLFDISPELYGRPLAVQFIGFLRPERKFDHLDALKAQIAQDCKTARAILAAAPTSAAPPLF